jgi:hypothetical protein
MPATTPPKKKLSPTLKYQLRRFCETHYPGRVSSNLRRMLLDYLDNELQVGIPCYLEELLFQLNDLFDLLDTAAQETEGWRADDISSTSKNQNP